MIRNFRAIIVAAIIAGSSLMLTSEQTITPAGAAKALLTTQTQNSSSERKLQQAKPWRDPSPHAVQFVTVDKDVRLEVLDWGGSGRPVVLLAGGGDTAHIFDEFAPKLTGNYHVYGITRRGFGASGFSSSDRIADRLGEDVLAVMKALKLKRPVLAGHSIAGAELSWVANARPGKLAGLVYLEAGYPYAFDNGKGPTMKEFESGGGGGSQSSGPPGSNLVSFTALQEWDTRVFGIRRPEAELRQTWDSTPDGRPLKPRSSPGSSIFMKLLNPPRKYATIPVPALFIFAIPHVKEPGSGKAADAFFARVDAAGERQAKAIEDGVPTARVVRLSGMHRIFLSNEQDVLREMRTFIDGLK